MGNPAVPLVREVRAPHREVVLPVEAAVQRRRERKVAEREVLGARDFRARRDLVVEREVGRRRHDVAPARGVQVADVLVDAVHVFVHERLERDAAVAPVLVEREVVALAEVVADPRIAERRRDLARKAVGRGRVDAGRVQSARLGLPGEVQEALVALPELQRVADALLHAEVDDLVVVQLVGLPVGEAEATHLHLAFVGVDAGADVDPRVFRQRSLYGLRTRRRDYLIRSQHLVGRVGPAA